MLDNDTSGFSEETSSYVPEASSSETQSTTEFDVDRVDNISQLREHVKGLKADLDSYKSTHNFVSENFGDLENAKLAHQLYNGIVADEFEPDYFYDAIKELSPSRAQKLAESLGRHYAPTYAEQKLSEYFGGDISPEEVELFRQWKTSGYMITDQDDLPDAFKYDAYGNPLSDEQVEQFKNQFKMLNELKSRVENQVSQAEQWQQEELRQQQEMEKQQRIGQFDMSNLRVLEADFEKFGLGLSDSDSPDQRSQKEVIREFLIGGIGKLFLSNPEHAKNYQTALSHLENGESRLARRYEPKIQKGLLDIVRSEPISKLLSSMVPTAPRQARPEISNSGVSAPTATEGGNREERIRNLVANGALRL